MFQKSLVTLMISIVLKFIQSDKEVPVQCGTHEVFVWCMNRNEPSCRNPTSFGYWECAGYCICQKKLVRDDAGMCIPMEACPPACPKASVFEQCSKIYEQLCGQKKGHRVENACTPGCSCLPGYCWEEDSKSCLKLRKHIGFRSDFMIPRIG